MFTGSLQRYMHQHLSLGQSQKLTAYGAPCKMHEPDIQGRRSSLQVPWVSSLYHVIHSTKTVQ